MTPDAIKHLKHIVIWLGLGLGVLGVGALAIRSKVEAYKVDRMAKRDEVIAENQVKAANAAQRAETATNANTTLDTLKTAHDKEMAAELARRPTTEQIQAIVDSRLHGATITTGPGENVDIHTTADAINRANVGFETCQFNLSDCEAKQANFQTIIAAGNQEIAADKSTIELQAKQINDLRRNQVPRWTAMLGVGKTQGSSFQDPQSYQPFLGLDYRLTSRIGVFGAAQNKSAAAGISWHFGAVR